MMLIQDKTIAIVGGGPGGLTLARLLQQQGGQVNVYERDLNRDVRVQGATLDLHDDSGLKALRAAGLIEAFQKHYRPGADRFRIVDEHAQIHYDDHEQANDIDFGHEHFRPEIDRGPLRNMLLDALQPGTVVWDSNIDTLVRINGSWQLTFRNGSAATADIVIAADGANSKIRPLLTPIKAEYCGYTAVEGTIYDAEQIVPGIFQLLKGGKIFAFGNSQTIIVSAKGDGSIAFYPCWKTDISWSADNTVDFSNKQERLDWFKTKFQGWDPFWTALFDNDNTTFAVRPLYSMPTDQTWEAQPDLTMLGDAAHLMPPYAGEGVNMAMLDALELSECLTSTGFPDIQSAIAHYEMNMRKRASAVAQMSVESTIALHASGSLEYMMSMFSDM